MGVVQVLDKARMLEIEANSVVAGVVDGSGHLILTRHDGTTFDAGSVLGPQPPLATDAETIAGTLTTKAVSPKSLQALTSTELRRGIVQLASAAEAVAATDTAKAVTSAGLLSFSRRSPSLGTDDLNDSKYQFTGIFVQDTPANATLLRNYPKASIGGLLEVAAGNNGDVVQSYTSRSGEFGGWVRVGRSGVWTTWRKTWSGLAVPPAFQARGVGNLSKSGAASAFTLILANATYNPGSHYNPANGRFTAPRDGLYEFSANAAQSSAVSGPELSIYKNGALEYGAAAIGYSTAYMAFGGSWRIPLLKDDYVVLAVTNNNGVAVVLDGARTSFGGHLLFET